MALKTSIMNKNKLVVLAAGALAGIVSGEPTVGEYKPMRFDLPKIKLKALKDNSKWYANIGKTRKRKK